MILRPATLNDADLLLEWRNDSTTRANSFTSEIVSLEDHLNWFKKVLASEDRCIYIAEDGNIPIGTIRVDIINSRQKELSWNVSPSHRKMGYGSKILEKFITEYPSVYIARIKSENIPSIKMVESNGFSIMTTEDNVYTFIKKPSDLEIIDAIQRIRNSNNVNWMDLLRIAFKHAPDEARAVFKRITSSDNAIGDLSKLLADNE